MTDSVEHTPSSPPEPAGIPDVSPEAIEAFLASHGQTFEQLFAAIKAEEPNLIQFIMGRAEQLAPHDLRTQETATRVAMEILALMAAENQAAAMDAWLDTTPSDKS